MANNRNPLIGGLISFGRWHWVGTFRFPRKLVRMEGSDEQSVHDRKRLYSPVSIVHHSMTTTGMSKWYLANLIITPV